MASEPKKVLRIREGVYVGDTPELRTQYPQATPVEIITPSREEVKAGVGIVEVGAKPTRKKKVSKKKAPSVAISVEPFEAGQDITDGEDSR